MNPAAVLQAWSPRVRRVPSLDTASTCRHCLGPTRPGYSTCFVCEFMWSAHPEFHGSCDLIVPATVAVQPSDWYSAVRQYKSGAVNFTPFAPALAVVLREWLLNHSAKVAAAIGGAVDFVAVVPSRSTPPPTPLYKVTRWAVGNTPALAGIEISPDGVRFVGSVPPAKHKRLYPDSLEAGVDFAGRRVLLLEDTWVSGSTSLSAAVALRRAGAIGVALISIARMVYDDGMTPDYEQAAVAPIDFTHWPR